MRFWKGFLPNACIALNIALLIVIYLDRRNPMMGFLMGAPFLVLAIATGVASVCVAVTLYAQWRKPKKRRKKPEKMAENT